MKDYIYDVYLSFTGADRELKNNIREHLSGLGFSSYDSDEYCMGQFRQNYMEALDKSRVFLMILTDNLRNDPAISGGGSLTEVRKELSLATELEAKNELNIIILCLSDFFRFRNGFHNYNDTIGWLFYTHTRGFSTVYGELSGGTGLSERSLTEISSRVRIFIEKRAEGAPVISQAPVIGITDERIAPRTRLYGREREVDAVLKAFAEGKQTVALCGIGGMGKTALATEIARKCNEAGYLRCPQIVHIQELGGTGGALHAIVSSVSYGTEVYDSLAYLSERDRYERKLKALRELPENILLVIDNYNSLRDDDIEDIISKLRCRILITTRSQNLCDADNFSMVRIGCLDEKDAKMMFEDLVRYEVDKASFSELYAYTGGHTITLCIIAKMLSSHGIGISDIIKRLDSLTDMSATVEFRHNEYLESNTVLGHLEKLFSITSFTEDALEILRSMSLISDGRMTASDILKYLGRDNRNGILELTAKGWLTAEDGADTLYLHPMISHLMARLLSPSICLCGHMITYLLDRITAMKEDMTYSEATVGAERLYFATYVIAASSGELAYDLWQEYVRLSELTADADEAARRSNAIIALLRDEKDKALVASYRDMTLIEQYPTRIDVIKGYLSSLSENSYNYKWIMRSLSVCAPHLCDVPEAREELHRVILDATEAAIRKEDDFALAELVGYALRIYPRKDVLSLIGKYIGEKQKARATADGEFLYLCSIYLATGGSRAKDISTVLERSQKMLSTIIEGNTLKLLGVFIKNPLFLIKARRLYSGIEALPESDPMKFFFDCTYDVGGKLADAAELDIRSLIDTVISLHAVRIERGMTLASAANVVSSFLSYFSELPLRLVCGETAAITEQINESDVSVRALSSLHVAMLINRTLGDRSAIEQSRKMLKLIERIRPNGHADLIDTKLSHASTLAAFGETAGAAELFLEVYHELKENAALSSVLSNVSADLLLYLDPATADPALIKEAFITATKNLSRDDLSYHAILNTYARLICSRRALEERSADGVSEITAVYINELTMELTELTKHRKHLSTASQSWLISTLHECAFKLYPSDTASASLLANCLRLMRRGSRGNIGNRADALFTEYAYFCKVRETKIASEKAEYNLLIIGSLIKNNVYPELASQLFSLNASYLSQDGSIRCDEVRYLTSLLGYEPNEYLLTRTREFMNSGIGFLEGSPFSDEKKERIRRDVFADFVKREADEGRKVSFGITPREYKKLKHATFFTTQAYLYILDSLERRTEKRPFIIRPAINTK